MSSKRPRHSAERPPPLAFADVKPILSRLERIADSVVLVGGQAVNFWAELYAPRVPAIDREAPFTSKDIDFCGDVRAVRICADRLGGMSRVATMDDNTPNTGVVTFLDDDGVDRRGCPVTVSVYDWNTNDPKTLMPQVAKLRDDFGLERVVLVGDRGMIGQAAVEDLRNLTGLEWITALKSSQIRTLVEGGALQLGLFDKRNLFELTHPDYPGERLVACRNAELGKLRAHKRKALLEATTKDLEKVRTMVERGDLRGAGKIGVRAGRVVNRHKVAKHFDLSIEDAHFQFALREEQHAAEAALDGIYVIRTSLSKNEMSGPEAVRSYKALSEVERAFRTLKTVDLEVRPIHHHLADRVRAHIFLCMLAYYVEWHMREAWRPLLFADEDLEAKATRDPVAPAKRSEAALEKVATKTLADGSPVHSFRTLVNDLSTIVRNTCRTPGAPTAPTFAIVTTPTPAQQRAMNLLESIAA